MDNMAGRWAATIKACSTTSSRGITMKPWIKKTLFGVLGASVLFGGLSACSGHRHGMGMTDADSASRQAKMMDYAGKKLDLNDGQKQKLAVLADKLREQRTALIGKTTDPRAEMQSLVAGATLDKTKAQALVEEKTGALRSKSPEVIAAAADFFDNLNPAQQQQVRELMTSRRRGWGG
jgi:periplasmic protein CpxP/Spy